MATTKQGNTTPGADAAQMAQDGSDFLNAYAGQGTEGIGQNAVSLSYLSILQDLSDVVVARQFEPGVFFNTGIQQDLGTEVKVIPVAFKTVWDERDQGGKTVSRYEPHAIEVIEEPVPIGQSGFPVKKNPKTGNKIVETFAYALVLADHPEAGFLMHTAGLGSMKVYRRWNTMLKQMRLPNGQQAPIFAKIWTLVSGVKQSKTVNKPFYALTDVIEGEYVNRDLFAQAVLPARESSTALLLSAPTTNEEVEE